jgi:tRNA threonylcarbamoyladenosine biosynthesis protein TsaB
VKILALDTATEFCSIALWRDGAVIERLETGNRHAERILALVQEVLAESGDSLAQLDAVAFGRGPGSFTGLRIGAGVTQGLAFGADVPVVAVSSLAALAQGIDAPRILAAIDARMNQVYWAACRRGDDGLVRVAGGEIVVAPRGVPLPEDGDWTGAGSGWDHYGESLRARLGPRVVSCRADQYPRARDVAALAVPEVLGGRTLMPEQAIPVYLRDDVAARMKPLS